MSTSTVPELLAAKRFETARRTARKLLQSPDQVTPKNVLDLHDALVQLADFHTARELLEAYEERFPDHRFEFSLKLANDFRTLSIEGHYRLSTEAKQGYTIDEYVEKYRKLAAEKLTELEHLAITPEQKARLTSAADPQKAAVANPASEPRTGSARLRGNIRHADGSPATHATVTLGLRTEVIHVDPRTYYTHHMHYVPTLGPVEKLTAETDASGAFEITDIPADTHDYLAVTLDPAKWEIPTRFLVRSLEIPEAGTVDLGDLTITEWQSAPAETGQPQHPETLEAEGVSWSKLTEWPLRNPFYYSFRRQLVRYPLPAGAKPGAAFRVEIEPGHSELCQVSGNEIAFLTDLPARTDRRLALFTTDAKPAATPSPLQLVEESPAVWRIDTGTASFRIAGNANDGSLAPILSVKGADDLWRGRGRFTFANGETIERQATRVLEQGPLFLRVRCEFAISGGRNYSLELTALAGEPYLLAHECSDEIAGAAFEFSLREFSGGRGYLHWNGENGGWHWATLTAEEQTIARLPESIPWWIPPQGFGYAMTPEGLDETDYLAVFSRNRGDWVDRKFERIANGPVDRGGRENREMDWPYPEMVGSSISMITAHTNRSGDAFFRFGMFDGERQWGLLASTLEQNDGPYKEIAAIQHGNSSPRLQEFKDWHLDEPDAVSRPHVVLQRDQLPRLREKSRSARFAPLWNKIRDGRVPGPSAGLAFAIDCDPAVAWRKRTELLAIAEIRAKMTLLGRDWSDIYSPVGGRPITPWAEEYDLIAASGVFSPDEERQMRAFFILMGHMFMETDFMNWKFNGRNANFEADRVDIVAAIGLVFDGHPDAEKFLDHVIERTHKSLTVYCTPGSGKWYENPACYYLHASKCRMNLVYHLANHGRLDVTQIPRLKDFLNWSLVLLTPEQPVSYALMRDGGSEAEYATTEKIRKVPPVGDHAGLGRWLPEHYFFIGKLFKQKDPEFGQKLLDAYFLSSGDGKRLLHNYSYPISQVGEQLFHDVAAGSSFGNLPLLFTSIEETDIPEAPQLEPVSRRLEGFGAVLRNRVNTPEEDYVLVKQGPGGYRYQRTEGGFIFFAEGKPLVYEGGEAGETWRHSTLSFHDVRMPMSAGRVERFFSRPEFQFVQGIHPEIIGPGKPVFLSDSCEHELVEECYRRYEKPNPAVVRAFAYVGSEYLVIHDTLDIDPAIPSHWHLQVAGDAPVGSGGHYEFKGRFGVDLQVSLPGQTFEAEMTEKVPFLEYHCQPEERFALQHLQLRSTTARNYLAVLRPLSPKSPARVSTGALHAGKDLVGARVTAEGISDYLVFQRAGAEFAETDFHFHGRYGASIQRPGRNSLWLGSPGEISRGPLRLRSSADFALLAQDESGLRLQTEGTGEIEISLNGSTHVFQVSGSENRTVG